MAVQQWTTTGFELTPAGDASPAEGDDRIRELKETAGSLLDKEHIARDAGSTAAQGWHRAGSAIAYYQAAAPTNRPDDATALGATDAGRVWIDSDDGGAKYWDGSAFQWVYGQDLKTSANVVFTTVNGMTDAEMSQIENIGTTTISAAQWGYLGGLNQALATTSNVTHANVTASGDVSVTGGITAHSYITPNTLLDSSSPTNGQIYTALSADLEDGGTMMVSGGIGTGGNDLLAVGYATRSGTTITVHGVRSTTGAYGAVSCVSGGSTTYSAVLLAW